MHEQTQPSGLLQVSMVPEPPNLFLALGGELDLCTVKEIPRDAYLSRADLTTVLIDLGELTFCDLTGLRALLAFRRIHQKQGRSVAVVRANPFIWKLLRICDVTDRLELLRPPESPRVPRPSRRDVAAATGARGPRVRQVRTAL